MTEYSLRLFKGIVLFKNAWAAFAFKYRLQGPRLDLKFYLNKLLHTF